MKLDDIEKEARDLELEINRYELLACQSYCKNRGTYLYHMWSATHKLLKLTKHNKNGIEYSDKAPYPHLDAEGDNITVGDVVMDESTVGSKATRL